MRLILRSARDPLFQQILLFCRENLVRLGWRHDVIRVRCVNPANELALLWLAGDNCRLAVFARKDSVFKSIKPQIGFARGGIRAVARKTVLRKNRPDVAIVSERARSERRAGK